MALLRKYRTVLSNFTYLSLLNGLDIALPLLVIPYLTNVVGAEYFGDYAFVLAVVQTVNIVTSYGFLYSATKKISQNRDDHIVVNKIFNAVISCRFIIALIIVTCLLLGESFIFRSEVQLFMFFTSIGMIFGDVFIPTWLFQGLEKMKYVTIVSSTSKILFTLLIFLTVSSKEDYMYILLMSSIGTIVAALLSMILVRRMFSLRLLMPCWYDMKCELTDGFAIFLSTIGMTAYRNFNIIILNYFVSSSAVGIYALAEKVIKAVQSLVNPISQALFPYFGYILKSKAVEGKAQNIRVLGKISLVLTSVLMVVAVVVFFSSGLLGSLLGKDFTTVSPIIDIMLPVLVFGCLNYLLGFVGLVNLNCQRFFFFSVISSGTVSILLLFLLVNFIGVAGAAFAMSVSEMLLFVCFLIKLIKIYETNKKIV